jgi:hypothetical protein
MEASVATTQPTLETTVPCRPAVPDVLYEHIEEIAYLSIQRRKLLFSPEIPLRRLRTHAGRIEAHLDGLRIGAPASVDIAHTMLDGDDPWFVSTALRIWIELGQPQTEIVHQRLALLAPELSGSCKEAFRQLPTATIERIFPEQHLETVPQSLLELAIDARGWHGLVRPETASRLAASPVPGVRRALARHVFQHDLVFRLLTDSDQEVRRVALWSLAKQDSQAALDRSRQLAAGAEPDVFALRLVGLLGDQADGSRVLPFLRNKTTVPFALLALRDLGYPALADSVLEVAEAGDPKCAPLATTVLESLTGRIPKPNPEKPLPPGVSPARVHWQEFRKHFDTSTRTLRGRPFRWQGSPADEPMLWVWRRYLTAKATDSEWIRREVPDGFFSGREADEAVPGE